MLGPPGALDPLPRPLGYPAPWLAPCEAEGAPIRPRPHHNTQRGTPGPGPSRDKNSPTRAEEHPSLGLQRPRNGPLAHDSSAGYRP